VMHEMNNACVKDMQAYVKPMLNSRLNPRKPS